MNTALIRLAAGAVLAVALTGAASAAEATLHVKASTSAALAGKCTAATVLFAKFTEDDAKEGDARPMTDMAMTWLTFLQTKDNAYQTAALEQMKVTTEGYSTAVEKSSTEGLTAVAGDVASCIMEME
ncbi:MAG: hypothetical protein JWR84_873 [Caulobacter sp.]|nr:hypothetical protein [Caulobacter sp.]